jgi:hypothetical protein
MIVKLLSIIKTLISEDDRLVKGSKVLVKTNYKGYNYVLEYGDHAFKRFDRYQNIEPMTKEEVSEMFYEALPELSKRAFGTNRTAMMSPIIDGIGYLKDKKTGQIKKLQQPVKFYIIRRSNSNAQVLLMVNDYDKDGDTIVYRVMTVMKSPNENLDYNNPNKVRVNLNVFLESYQPEGYELFVIEL